MTVKAIAERWDCHVGVVYRQIATGKLAALHIGQGKRVPIAEVERFEQENTTAATR
ncbi:helix-turn-helix domain-containing protein [Rhodococcus sp. KB6]|uniref:helix-turn-helix domain-containing protein n=1 Tax=Rhodococcus sp. KB6 TaxID=1752066 RepID=UPI00156113DB|nr:helix-turn-helix domain-containing protein [Rhodococcus sp. KB6]